MMEQYVRARYQQWLVDPLAHRILDWVTPNQVTLFSGFLGLLVLPALMMHQVIPAIILLLLSGYCDTLDGTLARLNHQATDWGTVLDIMTDRLVEFAVVFALWCMAPDERGLWCLLMLGSMLLCITSFLVVGVFSQNDSQKGFYYSPGIMERAEAFCFFIAMMLLPNAFNTLACIFTLGVTLTAVIRLVQFYKSSCV